jgi:lysyl-tRNA synthetase class 2
MVELKGREKQIVGERIKKIDRLRSEGAEPYAYKFDLNEKRVYSVDVKEDFSKLKDEEKSGESVVIAGRVMSKRAFGKLNFFGVQDLRGTIQVVVQKGEVSDDVLKSFKDIDSGDIVGIEGEVMKTKTGEVSIMASGIFILTKAVLPLPDKHKGLKDEEEKLRKRYLDIIMNGDVKDIFVKKSRFWNSVRTFLLDRKFLEVETPVLENSAGGAAASPFSTHHNALDLDVYLRISMGELWQKKLLVAGYEKTFEIGRQFRNEGMDAEHLQDYTQMEFYWGYADFEDGMKLVEEMYKEIAMATLGGLKFEAQGHKIDLGKKWERYDFESLIMEKTGIGIYDVSKEDIVAKLTELNQEHDDSVDKWRLVDSLWKFCRKDLSGPGFLVGQPVELTPLAKRSRDDSRKVEQFQVILGGSEVGNGYSELNDPFEQEARFTEQAKLGEEGDDEAMEHDEDFVEALKHGMPPACGFGFSERLFAFMMGKPLRECVAFPLMRPEGAKTKDGNSKDTKIAVAIINNSADMEQWQKMNTVAHLNASFAARRGRELFMQDEIKTKDGKDIKLNIQHAIMIKEAGSNRDVLNLIREAKSEGLDISEFTREMMDTTDDRKVVSITKDKNLEDVEYLGVLIFGKKSIVEKVTKGFELVK